MKFAKLTHTHHPDEGHWNLILESKEDIHNYFEHEVKRSGLAFWEMWKKAKDYNDISHFIPRSPAITAGTGYSILMLSKEREISLVEACGIQDKFLIGKYLNMIKMIDAGYSIRTSASGGYCPMDTFFTVLDERPCSPTELTEYLLNPSVDLEKKDLNLSFDKHCIVLENQNVLSDEMYSRITQWGSAQIITHFKDRIQNYTFEEIYKLFDDWIKKQYSAYLLAETTMIDIEQFMNLKKVLEKVMENNYGRTLYINLLIHDIEKREQISTNVENIKIKFL